jgi:parvulin-like peptidyl-prolyl isomerase
MDALRNFLTGPRLFIIIAVCTIPFVFLGTGSLSTVFGGNIGTINGEKVTEIDLQTATNFAVQKYKSIYGEDFEFADLSNEIQIQAIKDELILQKVLLSNAKKLGFVNDFANLQTKKNIISNPQFSLNGVFDENIYENQVRANGHTKESYIELMTDLVASDIFRRALSQSGFSTPAEIKELTYLLEQSADVEFIKIDSNALKNSIVNTPEEVSEYYDNNKIKFFSNEKRSFKFIVLKPELYRNKVIVPDGFVESAYNEYLSKSSERTQIRFSHIMVEKLNYDSRDDALNKINLVNEKIKNGDDFVALASEFSEDIVTKDNGGDLEYFERDIFPPEFSIAIDELKLNQTSNIIELEETFHILKITEFNQEETLSLDDMRDSIINELIDTESMALMNDDYNSAEELISSNTSIEEIASFLDLDIGISDTLAKDNFTFQIDDPRINEGVFSNAIGFNEPSIIDLGDSAIILSINEVIEPILKSFDEVKNDADDYLASVKATEKQILLTNEIKASKANGQLDSFIEPYGDFIKKDSFVNLKRFSTLMPREVIFEVFNNTTNETFISNVSNGDTYIVDIIGFTMPTDEFVNEVSNEYKSFSDERISNIISVVINDEIFEDANVNLNNLIF